MPLHGQRAARGAFDGECFDQAIRCRRLDSQALAEPLDALVMQRVNRYATASRQLRKPTPRDDVQVVAVFVPALDGTRMVALAMVETTVLLVYSWVQSATKRHVQFLKTTAYAEYRHTRSNQLRDQGQHNSISVGVELCCRGQGRSPIAFGRNVRWAAREQYSVYPSDQAFGIDSFCRGWQQEWQTFPYLAYGAHIALKTNIGRMTVEFGAVRQDRNNWARPE